MIGDDGVLEPAAEGASAEMGEEAESAEEAEEDEEEPAAADVAAAKKKKVTPQLPPPPAPPLPAAKAQAKRKAPLIADDSEPAVHVSVSHLCESPAPHAYVRIFC